MRTIIVCGGQKAIVDDEDYEVLSRYNWYLSCGYAVTDIWQRKWEHGKFVPGERFRIRPELSSRYMHRIIMKPPDDVPIDHKNGDRLDNQRSNLRLCQHHQNLANRGLPRNNTSGYKGVRLDRGRWRAGIKVHGRTLHLGFFRNAEEAATAYDHAAIHHFGDFAVTNASLRQET